MPLPLGNTIIAQAVMDAIVTEVGEKALLHSGCSGVGVDIPQGIQRSALSHIGKACAVVSLLPKVPATVLHSVKTHGSIPVEPMHDFG